jgi:hypothetical protein
LISKHRRLTVKKKPQSWPFENAEAEAYQKPEAEMEGWLTYLSKICMF